MTRARLDLTGSTVSPGGAVVTTYRAHGAGARAPYGAVDVSVSVAQRGDDGAPYRVTVREVPRGVAGAWRAMSADVARRLARMAAPRGATLERRRLLREDGGWTHVYVIAGVEQSSVSAPRRAARALEAAGVADIVHTALDAYLDGDDDAHDDVERAAAAALVGAIRREVGLIRCGDVWIAR